MILRRLVTAIRKQDWFTVLIETLIVVLGVFIGIQLGNWNEARALDRTEAQLLLRLENDLRQSKVKTERDVAEAKLIHEGWVHTFRALETCTSAPEHRDAISYALAQYQRSFLLEIQRSAFEEMKSTGIFSRLRDTELQDRLTELYARADTGSISELTGRENQLATSRIMWKYIAFSFANDDPYDDGTDYDAWGTAAFDPLQHCDNLELRGAIWEMVDTNRDYLYVAREYLAALDSILVDLEATP